jgi:hypothetical protein
MLTPSAGTKLYNETFTSGQVFDSVGGRRVEPRMYDGNYVIASHHKHPWRKQLNLLLGYLYFYNPLWLLAALTKRKTKVGLKPAYMQVFGMLGLFHTTRRTLGWAARLRFGKIERLSQTPAGSIPMRDVDGGSASHDPSAASAPACTVPGPRMVQIEIPRPRAAVVTSGQKKGLRD